MHNKLHCISNFDWQVIKCERIKKQNSMFNGNVSDWYDCALIKF